MIKFIIVNHDLEMIHHITHLLNEEVKVKHKIVNYSIFNKDLKKEIENLDERKIYILNIELEGNISGITIAKSIREIDLDSEIIFITRHTKMFELAFRTVPKIYDFIELFHDFDKRFKKDIHNIIKIKYDEEMLCYDKCNEVFQIYYKSIYYIYRDKNERKLVIVTNTGSYKVNMKLDEILGLLDNRFERCHRSCIVNKEHVQVRNYKDGYFILDNGKKVYMLVKNHKKQNIDVKA